MRSEMLIVSCLLSVSAWACHQAAPNTQDESLVGTVRKRTGWRGEKGGKAPENREFLKPQNSQGQLIFKGLVFVLKPRVPARSFKHTIPPPKLQGGRGSV